jgi:hypothetical protein
MFVSKPLALSLALCIATVKAWSTQTFKSMSLVTPIFYVTKSGEPRALGYLFLTTISLPYPAAVIIKRMKANWFGLGKSVDILTSMSKL